MIVCLCMDRQRTHLCNDNDHNNNNIIIICAFYYYYYLLVGYYLQVHDDLLEQSAEGIAIFADPVTFHSVNGNTHGRTLTVSYTIELEKHKHTQHTFSNSTNVIYPVWKSLSSIHGRKPSRR